MTRKKTSVMMTLKMTVTTRMRRKTMTIPKMTATMTAKKAKR
jgi:hypothetical protein